MFLLVLMSVSIAGAAMLPIGTVYAACDRDAIHLHHFNFADLNYNDLRPDNMRYILEHPHEMKWHELYRPYTTDCCCLCDYDLGWEDANGDGILSVSDQVGITPILPDACPLLGCLAGSYHVDQVTVTLHVTPTAPLPPFHPMYIEFEGDILDNPWRPPMIIPGSGWLSPNSTQWCEACDWPQTDLCDVCWSWQYHLQNWQDGQIVGQPGYGNLSVSDNIDLQDKDTLVFAQFHVDEVRVDLALTPLRVAVPVFPNWYTIVAAIAVTGGLGYLIWRRKIIGQKS